MKINYAHFKWLFILKGGKRYGQKHCFIHRGGLVTDTNVCMILNAFARLYFLSFHLKLAYVHNVQSPMKIHWRLSDFLFLEMVS